MALLKLSTALLALFAVATTASSSNDNSTLDDGTIIVHEDPQDYGITEPDTTVIVEETTPVDNDPDDNTPFLHFVAHNKTMTCSADTHARPFNSQIRGVNLGGWMVLEPWITPSLFTQFLGGTDSNNTAFDTYTFCEVLGPKEANRQLKEHWKRWVTQDIINELAASQAVNSLRLPIGDFMFVPYGPYEGCFDGALDLVDDMLDWAHNASLSVLLDIHSMKGSQNGFDNSGQSLGFQWTSSLNQEFGGQVTFEHWPIRSAEWMGTFDPKAANYSTINYDNIQHGLNVIEAVVHRYGGHPAVLGLEPVNEPWNFTPIDLLKRFYWEGYLIVKKFAPYWKYIMHDSFRFTTDVWGGFMAGCPERAIDTHIYQAWRNPDTRLGFYTDACHQKALIAAMENEFGPVIVGEWSLATDNCAMWLNGFNDNLPGFPKLPCKYSPCAESYMGDKQPGGPIDPAKPMQGPFGTGMSGPIYGLCPGSRDWLRQPNGNPMVGKDWILAPPNAPKHLDDTDEVMTRLAHKKIDAFSGFGHGFYFWNFRTDLYEPQWSYMAALERGWIPRGSLSNNAEITNACRREDEGAFRCVLRHGQLEETIRGAIGYVLNVQNKSDTAEGQHVMNMTGTDLQQAGQEVLSDYFEKYRHSGATCDFGGIAMLIEENATYTDDDSIHFDDDYYFEFQHGHRVPTVYVVLIGVAVGVLGALIGFILAMNFSSGFNKRVQSMSIMKPITKSRSRVLRSSLKLPALEDEELQYLLDQH